MEANFSIFCSVKGKICHGVTAQSESLIVEIPVYYFTLPNVPVGPGGWLE